MSLDSLSDFLEPVNLSQITGDGEMREGQMGRTILIHQQELPDISNADIVIAGCEELRGDGFPGAKAGIDNIRKEFYALYSWHNNIQLADLGNIHCGATLQDTYAAIKAVAAEVLKAGKHFILLGGSNDLALALYEVYRTEKKIIEVTGIDAYIDLSIDNPIKSKNFLMEMLTGEPNFIRHYNHIGFQSYYVHPHMLETMDKLRFDCFRLGKVKENIDEVEPGIRSSDMLLFDLAALGSATFWEGSSPNGFNGEEASTLTRFAGMNPKLKTMGIFGYQQQHDPFNNLAKQVSQMLWYYIDGVYQGRNEASLNDREMFIECHVAFATVETTFIKSMRTGRWWMKMPDGQYVPCSYNDFQVAGENEIPERWLRLQERS
ncbi:MAG: arginase family protein [Chitinophagia bacterium]|jgi:formiminoglutamase